MVNSNDKVKILWSGITGRVGKEALEVSKTNDYAEIVAGVCRNNNRFYNYDELESIKEDFDVIVEFSHKDSIDKVLDYALKVKKPIIIGTSGLSLQQIKKIEDASNVIPVFRGGNFRFEVKSFIDDVVLYAKNCKENDIELIETFYKTKHVPSDTGKEIAKRVFNETGKKVEIKSFLKYDNIVSEWEVVNLHCKVEGFNDIANDVLKIANMMKDKVPNGVYDLDKLCK